MLLLPVIGYCLFVVGGVCCLSSWRGSGGGGLNSLSQVQSPITEYIPLIFVTPPNKSGLSHFAACSLDFFTVRSHL